MKRLFDACCQIPLSSCSEIYRQNTKGDDPITDLGHLQVKEEAAGKVRVFAFVDI